MIVLTGVSGFIGSQLVERLRREMQNPFLLVTRDGAALRAKYPDSAICEYAELPNYDLAGATWIHMAARNNDRPGTKQEFLEANVEHLMRTASIARGAGSTRFVNICSTHALQPKAGDLYGISKHEGAEKLAAFWPDGAINLYLPAVYGATFRGRLARLNRLPPLLQRFALDALRLVKPMVSIDVVAQTIARIIDEPVADGTKGINGERYAADPVPQLFSIVKRAIDLLAAVAIILFLGWAMVLIALYIRIDSKGPAIFAQKRVGRYGRVFTCYKFRTMEVGTTQAATHDVNAVAITRAGRFLRRTKLDELPQIFNVLINEMSLVGPRPCLPLQSELVALRAERGILALKPGITGLAQVNDIDMSHPARLAAWDDRYRSFRTLYLDVVLLFRTVLGGGTGDRVAEHVRDS